MSGTLAQTRGCVLKLVQARASGDEAVDRPAGEAEQPQLLARGRVHRQPVGVVGIALRAAHFFGVAVAPDRALAQQPVRRQPRAREHDRRPPRVPGEDHGGRDAADHLDHAGRDEIHGDRQRRAGHPEIEVARDGEVAGERRILEVPHARRAHAGFGEPVVEPGGGAVAEVGADRLMNRAEHLKQHEDRAGERERAGERIAALDGADEHAHRDRERRRQDASQQEADPPGGGESRGLPSAERRRTSIPCARSVRGARPHSASDPARGHRGGGGSATRFCVRADCRAASRISVTITLLASDDRPLG